MPHGQSLRLGHVLGGPGPNSDEPNRTGSETEEGVERTGEGRMLEERFKGLLTWALCLEMGVGLLLVTTMGLAACILGLFRGGWEIGIVVGLVMTSIVVVANLTGVIIPFLLMRLRLDPAVASSPLITSMADLAGLIIYFSIARQVLASVG